MAASTRLLVVVVGLLLGALIGSIVWGVSNRNRADALAASRASSEERVVQTKGWNIPILSALIKALESGDYARVRALFTKDGVLTTAGDAFWMIDHNKKPQPGQRVDGAVFRHRISVHLGKRMKVLGTPVRIPSPFQVGSDTIAYAFKFPGTREGGTGLLHLRHGKIVVAIIDPAIPIRFGGG